MFYKMIENNDGSMFWDAVFWMSLIFIAFGVGVFTGYKMVNWGSTSTSPNSNSLSGAEYAYSNLDASKPKPVESDLMAGLKRKIVDMKLDGSHPYRGDITTKAYGGGNDNMDSTCEGRFYQYFIENGFFEGFGETCT